MLNFLNNNQNRKDHPNENFAREVMELFTMGRGHYTEEDVREAARAFTGWGAGLDGEFIFRRGQHDDGQKTVLGKTGHFEGEDVLNLLLEQKQTALFVTRKLYRYLVNEEVDEARVQWLADRWYQSNYNISALLQDIFQSDWWYDPSNVGNRIKSPVDLLVGIRRLLPMKIANEEVQLSLQRLLGQLLFYPPNVAGWPGGANWIDSSTLMFRLQIPELIYASEEFHLKPKEDDDQTMGMREREEGDRDPAMGFRPGTKAGTPRSAVAGIAPETTTDTMTPEKKVRENRKGGGQMIRAEIDWAPYLKRFEQVPDERLFAAVSGVVLQTPSGIGESLVRKYAKGNNREEFIKAATIRLMSTPEYQLC
jgi:hypothetical protein